LCLCSSCAADNPTENLGRSVNAVGGGTDDTANVFSAVARLVTGDGSNCTAVLATKRFAITAGHCFTGGTTQLRADLTFAYDPATVPTPDPDASSTPLPHQVQSKRCGPGLRMTTTGSGRRILLSFDSTR
jgi:hypothetical protein